MLFGLFFITALAMLDGSVETDRKAAETKTCELNKETKMCSNRREMMFFRPLAPYFTTEI